MSLAFGVFLIVWIVGVVMTFVPTLPATLVILLGALVAAFMDGNVNNDLMFLLAFALVSVFVMSVDNLASMWGAKKYGGSDGAIWGALLGGLVGLFIPFPFGLLGPFVGALIAELIAKKELPDALRAAWGTLLGLLTGMVAKLFLHVGIGIWALWHFWRVAAS